MTVSSTTTNPMYSLLTDNSQNNPVSTLLGSNTVDSTSASDVVGGTNFGSFVDNQVLFLDFFHC